MKKSVVLPLLMVVSLAAGIFLAPTGALGQSRSTRSKTTSRPKAQVSNESYVVVQIGDEYKAIRSTAVNDESKRLGTEYTKAMKDWPEDHKKDPTKEKPVKLTLRKIKTGLKSQQEATDYIKTLQEKDDAKPDGKEKAAEKKTVF